MFSYLILDRVLYFKVTLCFLIRQQCVVISAVKMKTFVRFILSTGIYKSSHIDVVSCFSNASICRTDQNRLN